MNVKLFSLTLLLSTAFYACQDSQTATEQQQHNVEKALGLDGKGVNIMREAMVIHDETMKGMSDIARFRNQISVEAAKPNADTKKLKALEAQLAEADQAMLDWMHNFKKPRNPEDSIEYLDRQKQGIVKTQQLINDALAAAKQQFGETK